MRDIFFIDDLSIGLIIFSFLRCKKSDFRFFTGNTLTPVTSAACSAFWAGTYTDLIFWFLATSAVIIADRIGRRLPSSASSPEKTALLTSLWLSAPLMHKIDKAMGRSK